MDGKVIKWASAVRDLLRCRRICNISRPLIIVSLDSNGSRHRPITGCNASSRNFKHDLEEHIDDMEHEVMGLPHRGVAGGQPGSPSRLPPTQHHRQMIQLAASMSIEEDEEEVRGACAEKGVEGQCVLDSSADAVETLGTLRECLRGEAGRAVLMVQDGSAGNLLDAIALLHLLNQASNDYWTDTGMEVRPDYFELKVCGGMRRFARF